LGCRWEEDAERRERFFYTALGGSGTPPALCTPEVVAAVVQQHLDCPSAWAIFPIQASASHVGRPCVYAPAGLLTIQRCVVSL
jgi:hypothetical protein